MLLVCRQERRKGSGLLVILVGIPDIIFSSSSPCPPWTFLYSEQFTMISLLLHLTGWCTHWRTEQSIAFPSAEKVTSVRNLLIPCFLFWRKSLWRFKQWLTLGPHRKVFERVRAKLHILVESLKFQANPQGMSVVSGLWKQQNYTSQEWWQEQPWPCQFSSNSVLLTCKMTFLYL